MGLRARVTPLFSVHPVGWQAPSPDGVDCVLLTSANAARHAGPQLAAFTRLPCFAVGESSAAAALEAGFRNVRAGDGDGADVLANAAEAGMERALHLCGREHIPLANPRLNVERRIVYAAEAAPALPDAALEALRSGALALLHSPRAAALFARLAEDAGLDWGAIAIAALSPNVLAAAGSGWKIAASAETPSDNALLELAAKLCQTSGSATGNHG
jgi:uroporphyrinogen-III synthase